SGREVFELDHLTTVAAAAHRALAEPIDLEPLAAQLQRQVLRRLGARNRVLVPPPAWRDQHRAPSPVRLHLVPLASLGPHERIAPTTQPEHVGARSVTVD